MIVALGNGDARLVDADRIRDAAEDKRKIDLAVSELEVQVSLEAEEKSVIDGSNQYLWKMSRRRLEAEEIRDSILQIN